MFWFVLSIILLVGALIAVVTGIASRNKAATSGCLGGAAVAVLVAIVLFFISGIREVPNKSIGVPTSIGRVGTVMRPGLHHTAPWTRVNILPETVQTTTFEGCQGAFCTGSNPKRGDCLEVRIGGQQTACLDVSIQWRILDAGGPGLYNSYGSSGNGSVITDITDAVVVRELKQVVNNEMGDYNPIQDVAANATSGNSQFSTFGPKVLAQMRSDLDGRIKVLNLYMPLLRYDSATQARLNSIQAQYAETAIAQQLQKTNAAQSAANKAITKSLSTADLTYLCLQIVQNAEKAGYTGLPATLNCIGSGSGVVAVKG